MLLPVEVTCRFRCTSNAAPVLLLLYCLPNSVSAWHAQQGSIIVFLGKEFPLAHTAAAGCFLNYLQAQQGNITVCQGDESPLATP
jgi:hypothetical protein